jgi:hypothetical protein
MLMTMMVLLLKDNGEMVAVPQQLIPQRTSILIDMMPYPLLRTKAPQGSLSDNHPAHTTQVQVQTPVQASIAGE